MIDYALSCKYLRAKEDVSDLKLNSVILGASSREKQFFRKLSS
jgi:hypothetical protein